jgi:pyruvate,water dikinase
LKPFDALDLGTLSDSQLIEQFWYLYTISLKHYRLVRWGIATHNMGMNMILKNLITQWYGEDPDRTHSILVSGLPPNKATETNKAIFKLVSVKRQDESRFEEGLQAFLDEYGHRSYSRDVMFPTWAEEPDIIRNMVDSLMENERDITDIEKEKRHEREELTEKVREEIRGQTYGFIKVRVFNFILGYAQKYIAFRENQRFFLDHQDYRFRRLFLEMGRRLKERKILKQISDIFFLFKEEIFTLFETETIDYQIIENRRKEFKQYEFTLPPKFLQGEREFDEQFSYEREFSGVPSSPGIVEGTIKTIRSIHELHTIKKGEILVATCTDPGWTPVFLKIKGLITETGGILSHGAVVSREYGIPAVTGVKQAMQFLHDGDTVIVDGNAGKIYVK